MPTISKKGNQMPESPIRKLVPYAEDAKKRGVKVYHLNIGQPDIKTPQVALDAVKNNNIETLSYARSEGSEEYRVKLSKYYKNNNIIFSYINIVVFIVFRKFYSILFRTFRTCIRQRFNIVVFNSI